MGSAAQARPPRLSARDGGQGISDEAYFAYVEEAIPRRTQPIGKRGQLEIENLAAADQEHKLNLVALL